ncbi:ecdysone oxidase-like [Leptidea sinapis]|uniref:ecdysone oxidase-like n=1 Tax=Leptidea sinapis TaxID=189913 RepID=UPI0021C3C554|nr:ecdysone oxidase-like [Leptidea sinapis]XP_050670100.1 ecdysone oxidase-like [Leptidea sinapis]XP_050670101.1 ecdysone oxidase-like [Leptidea sinapis]XP_050670102.1 ecdysone oxidase-like [Leptidea sinapis]XP_050670104.1 ecdysone oxidase-like [Leptidea sinapis]XP_050670105.1 ecdysone oxidase-like [Leptidea sinapis]XP_050670106.1 ecdysone oxidase-like [Leptidea sinapis]XP_050670107.1 ecdysone oxidase-like [Leptidea sinapis]XP_050670108.1 ecdysone oxidase-like [Leptidea sinapis]XP_05067010
MMYTRGNRNDFDFGNSSGWTWKHVEPYFFKSERLENPQNFPNSSKNFHNSTGAVPVSFSDDADNTWKKRIIKGFELLNFPHNADVNADSQIGVSRVLSYTSNGKRVNIAEAYLDLARETGKLKVAKNTKCLKVIIDENNIARGVIVAHSDGYRNIHLYASREVVLSAGTIGTAQLLMLSGVGPADHLQELNIPVKMNLSVGVDMVDHAMSLIYMKVDHHGVQSDTLAMLTKAMHAVQWMVTRSGPLASIGLTDITAFLNTNCYDFIKRQLVNDRAECEVPTTQIIHAFMDRGITRIARRLYERIKQHDPLIVEQTVSQNERNDVLVIAPVVLAPESRGLVHLASADPARPPLIFPNYLADKRDVEEMVRAISVLDDLTRTPPFRERNATLLRYKLRGCPRAEAGARYWACYVRHMTHSPHHAVGTCALGRVLDARLRVHGVRGLRVADASVLPRPPRGNMAATVLAVAERAADMVLQDAAPPVHRS